MKTVYHSALRKEVFTSCECESKKTDCGEAFVFDITSGFLPKEYDQCDVFYSEPAWLDGYNIFLERANRSNTSDYDDYLKALSKIISTGKPTIMIIGKHAIKHLPKYDCAADVVLNGYKTNAYSWNCDLCGNFSTNNDLIEYVAKKYDVIGDFCCGYGNTLKIAKKYGKKCVLSDINKKCISYITENLL